MSRQRYKFIQSNNADTYSMNIIIILLTSVMSVQTCNGHMFGRNAEQMLYHDMMESYDDSFKNVRPVEHHEQNMTISFGVALVNLNR